MTWQATEHDILALCPLPHSFLPSLLALPISLAQNCFDLREEKNMALTDVADDKTPTPNSGITIFSIRRKS